MVAKLSRHLGGWTVPVDRSGGRFASALLVGDAARNGHLSDLEAWLDFLDNQEDVQPVKDEPQGDGQAKG